MKLIIEYTKTRNVQNVTVKPTSRSQLTDFTLFSITGITDHELKSTYFVLFSCF